MDDLNLNELERLAKAARLERWNRANLNAALLPLLSARDCADYATAVIFAGPALIAQAREAERWQRYFAVGLHSVEAVRQVMGDDVPLLGEYSDIPWIKRLREKTGCSLSQAKAAHDLLRLHARAEALEAENKRLREELETADTEYKKMRRWLSPYFISNTRALLRERRTHSNTPNWALIGMTFGFGSGTSYEICKVLGVDPDAFDRGRLLNHAEAKEAGNA